MPLVTSATPPWSSGVGCVREACLVERRHSEPSGVHGDWSGSCTRAGTDVWGWREPFRGPEPHAESLGQEAWPEVPLNFTRSFQDSAQWFSEAGLSSAGDFEKSNVGCTPSWPSPGLPRRRRGHTELREGLGAGLAHTLRGPFSVSGQLTEALE